MLKDAAMGTSKILMGDVILNKFLSLKTTIAIFFMVVLLLHLLPTHTHTPHNKVV